MIRIDGKLKIPRDIGEYVKWFKRQIAPIPKLEIAPEEWWEKTVVAKTKCECDRCGNEHLS